MWANGLHPAGRGNESQGRASLYYEAALASATPPLAAALAVAYRSCTARSLLRPCAPPLAILAAAATAFTAPPGATSTAPLQPPPRARIRLGDAIAQQKAAAEADAVRQYIAHSDPSRPGPYLVAAVSYLYGLRGLQRSPQRALDYYRLAAAAGDPRGHAGIGVVMLLPDAPGGGPNATAAREEFELAKGAAAALNGLGWMAAEGIGEEVNVTKAAALFARASRMRDVHGMYNYGVCQVEGIGVKMDRGAGCSNLLYAASSGHVQAHVAVAREYAREEAHRAGGFTPDERLAAFHFRAALFASVPLAAAHAAAYDTYLAGNYAAALVRYLILAECGSSTAQFNAALLLTKTDAARDAFPPPPAGTADAASPTPPVALRRALAIYRLLAATNFDSQAALFAGDMHYYGRGCPRDYARAAAYYQEARGRQNAQAMYNLGYMHQEGVGVPRSFELAKRLYDAASAASETASPVLSLARAWLHLRAAFAGEPLEGTMLQLLVAALRGDASADWVRGDIGGYLALVALAAGYILQPLLMRRRVPVGAVAPQRVDVG